MAGWAEARRSGRKPSVDVAIRAQIVTEVTQPPAGRTRWSSRAMAKATKGVSAHSVQRLWRANDLKLHLQRTFKLSRDRNFEAKFGDVIGLYLNPPDRALVLCGDEKSQCQALERTQPACHWVSGTSKPPPTITPATARSRYSTASAIWTAKSCDAPPLGIPTANGSVSSSTSMRRHPTAWSCI
ncbi:MAG: helix-turn-helix domain-containing protein [Candidatus Synoicihabitans palmerolidicus]|nr:helix-turn-helix domain-containing protein [Candidatus Synoicihabitans palmerolidicus]